MKLKKEYMILLGVIVVLLIVLIVGGRKNRMSYRVPDLDSLDRDSVTKIEIAKAGETLTVFSKDNRWDILPQEYKADPDKVSSMLDIISGLTLTELAAEAEDYQRYELDDENKISVRAYAGDDLVRTFDVGKVSSTYRHTFVRIQDDPRVYFARESFRTTFDVKRQDLRDKNVMSFDVNEITSVSVEQEGSTLLFSKTMLPAEPAAADTADETAAQPAENQEVWITEDGVRGKKTEVDSIVSQLSDLNCDSFIEGKSVEDFSSPLYSVKLTGNKDFSLQIFTKDEEADLYPAASSEMSYVFFLPTWKAENIMKKTEDLIEQDQVEKK